MTQTVPKISANFYGENGFPTIHNLLIKDVPEKMDQLEKFLKELARLEEEYSKGLEKALKNFNLTEAGSLGTVVENFISYNKQKAENAQYLSQQIQGGILEPFVQFKQGQKQFRNSTDQEAGKIHRDHEKLKQQFQKAVDKYEKECNETDKNIKLASEAQSQSKNKTTEVSKLNTKIQKHKKERENAKKEGLEITLKLNQYQKTREKLTSAYDNIQRFEEGKYEQYSGLFRKFCSAAQPEPLKLLQAVENLSFAGDMQLLIDEHGTSSENITEYTFPVHSDQDETEHFPERSLLDSTPDSSGMIEVPVIGKASVLYDYVGADEYELDLTSGDTVLILEKDRSGWWVGDSHGRVALFPSNYVSEIF